MRNSLGAFLRTLNITPKAQRVYEVALTHKSSMTSDASFHNERLEFLGDRVLGLVIAQWLFEEFENATEGALAKRQAVLISREILLKVAYDINLPSHLVISRALQKVSSERRASLYANAVEALIAAIYLDQGFLKATSFIRHYWKEYVSSVYETPQDSKSALQEWAQERGYIPSYEVVEISGPDHAPQFTVRVTLGKYESEIVKAPSKRKGEQKAAQQLLERLTAEK